MEQSSVKQKYLSLTVQRDGKLVSDLCVPEASGVHINAVLALAKVGDVVNIEIREMEISPVVHIPTNFDTSVKD